MNDFIDLLNKIDHLNDEDKEIIIKMRILMVKLHDICRNENISVKINALDMLSSFYKQNCIEIK